MGSKSRRQRTVDRKRTDQLGQSSRPIAQANEDRLRLRRQRYAEEQAERRATSSSQHVASGSQRGIRRKIIEMVDKLKSIRRNCRVRIQNFTRFLNHSSIRKALKVGSIMSLKEQHIGKLLLPNLSNGLQTVKGTHTRDDMIAKRCVVNGLGETWSSPEVLKRQNHSPRFFMTRGGRFFKSYNRPINWQIGVGIILILGGATTW
ncbi:hypothetical protein R1sor_000516 [Riccia sorocarpa]|uniref:Ribosomal protein S14 n=1 Tax=Riccia sorocarpa TaxID=122646 RepID=A0ABD3GXB1_9MARC